MTVLLLDIGTGELLALIVIAAVLLGPEKVPALAKKAGRLIRFLRRVANTATDQIKTELGADYEDLDISGLKPKNLVRNLLHDDMENELKSLREELAGMKTEVARLQLQTGVSPFRPASRPTSTTSASSSPTIEPAEPVIDAATLPTSTLPTSTLKLPEGTGSE